MYMLPRLMLGLGLITCGAGICAQESARSDRDASSDKSVALEEITVTGSHIRGSAPVGSPLIVVTREDLDKSGYGRVQDYMATLPQNFDGSTSEGFGVSADVGAANLTRGKGLDLRGLGASGTLILINGRRQPAGGLEGSFVDISSIPAAAIERIEILTDGASALYGSDAVGGVVNYILRKDYEGMEVNGRVASTDDFADEMQLAALGGHSWGNANLLFGYQYSRRDALLAADRPYSSMNQDYRSLGGSDFRNITSDPGTILDFQNPTYAIPRGQNGTNLTVGQLIPGEANYQEAGPGLSAQPGQEQHDAFMRFAWRPSERAELYAQGRYGRRDMDFKRAGESSILYVPETNPFAVNPYGSGGVFVAYDFSKIVGPLLESGQVDTYTLGVGADIALSGSWVLKVGADYGREKNQSLMRNAVSYDRLDACLSGIATSAQCPGAPLNVFGDGAIAVNDPATVGFIKDNYFLAGTSKIKTISAVTDGNLFDLPAGSVKLAVGADYRDESLSTVGYRFSPSNSVVVPNNPRLGNPDRQVSAAFAELLVPLLGDPAGGERGRLELSFAGRYEDYSDFGSTFDPKIGVSFAPTQDLLLRASWGTSFRAPRFNEANEATSSDSFAFEVADPRSPTGSSVVLWLSGADPNIGPETADIWTAGFDLQPIALAGLRISATYFHIDYKDKIAVGGDYASTLLAESDWAAIITRDPTPAQVDAICARPDFTDFGYGRCPFPTPPAAIMDLRLRNLSQLKLHGIDLDLNYRTDVLAGQLSFGLAGTYMLGYERSVSAGAPLVDIVDTVGYPAALRLRGSVSWSMQGWMASTMVNYVGAYDDPVRSRDVGSWTTVDVVAGYQFSHGSWLEDTILQVAATNAFDRKPPFVNIQAGFDSANARETGRSVSLSVTKRW